MPTMIKVTSESNIEMHINANYIVMVEPYEGGSLLWMKGSSGIRVKESPEKIHSIIYKTMVSCNCVC